MKHDQERKKLFSPSPLIHAMLGRLPFTPLKKSNNRIACRAVFCEVNHLSIEKIGKSVSPSFFPVIINSVHFQAGLWNVVLLSTNADQDPQLQIKKKMEEKCFGQTTSHLYRIINNILKQFCSISFSILHQGD